MIQTSITAKFTSQDMPEVTIQVNAKQLRFISQGLALLAKHEDQSLFQHRQAIESLSGNVANLHMALGGHVNPLIIDRGGPE